jgi:opacity protein-like surface antigen
MNRTALMGSLLAAALLPGAAFADMSYSNVELKYVDVELDDFSADGDGFEIAGSYGVSDKVFLLGRWQDQSFDFGIDGTEFEFGAGLHHALSDDVDFVGTLSYLDNEIDTAFGDFSDDGLGLGAGVRAQLGDSFQLDASLQYVDYDEAGSDTGLKVGGRYYFNDVMALSFGIDDADETDTFHMGFRWEF